MLCFMNVLIYSNGKAKYMYAIYAYLAIYPCRVYLLVT